MMILRPFGIAAAAAVVLAAPCLAQTTGSGALHPLARKAEVADALEVLDTWITATAAQREQPGVSVGIVYDQDLIWAKGYGYADLERRIPATPATLYRIASISKLFTATAIMQLRDAGKLRLDDPVSERLSWFSIKTSGHDSPAITMRHLITHTSGLPREAVGVDWNDVVYPTREAMRRSFPNQEAVYPPGTVWKYSNLALSIAGEVVGEVSGIPWAHYVEQRILQPLGMTATRTTPARDTPGLAVGYSPRRPGQKREPQPFVDAGAISPSASLASSVEDLAKFLSLQFREDEGRTQVLRGSTLREMHRIQWLNPDWQSGWGLGFRIRRVGDQVRVGHSGGVPGHSTNVETILDQKLGVIVLTNGADGNPTSYLEQAFDLVGPAIARAVAKPSASAVADPAWQQYVGRYRSRWGETQVKVLGSHLVMISPEAGDPWGSRVTLEPVAPGTFRMVQSGSVYGDAIGELITFETNARGEVVRMSRPGMHWLPAR